MSEDLNPQPETARKISTHILIAVGALAVLVVAGFGIYMSTRPQAGLNSSQQELCRLRQLQNEPLPPECESVVPPTQPR